MFRLFLAIATLLSAAGFIVAAPAPQGLPLIGTLPVIGGLLGGGAGTAAASPDPDATGSTGSTGSTGGAAPAAGGPLSSLLNLRV